MELRCKPAIAVSPVSFVDNLELGYGQLVTSRLLNGTPVEAGSVNL
jgi:hypothetical protein